MKNPIPEWLAQLPPGQYSLTQLMHLTGKDKAGLCRALARLKVEKKYGEPKGNLTPVTYVWKGVQQ